MHNSGEEEESRSGIWEAGNFLVKAAELHYDKKIASGNYGTVYKGKCRGYNVGIKLLHNQHLNEQKIEELKREVEIMSSLRHPCILLLMGVCTEKEKLALVMEYVEGRDLEHVIHDPGVPLTVQHQLKIAKGIAQGMNWLHCLKPIPIIHRDLKPPNILVTKDFEVKVCDFGLSCVKEKFDPKAPPKDKAVGTPVWMAPEILCGMPASEKSDVYAYGLVLWELFTRKERPFAHVTSFAEFCDDVIDRHVRPTLTDDIPPEVQRLIRKCWAPNMNDRPLFGAVIEFLDDIFVDTLVKDPAARELWKRLNRKEGYPDRVKWEDFVTVLTSALGIRPDNPQFLFQPNSPSYNCVREFLTEADKDLTSSESEKNRIVTCENWGRFVEVFGPYHDKILQNFCDLCRKGCFHGSIDAKEAERRLSSEKPGAYLIRLSSKDNCISISKRVRSGGHFNHQRAHKEGSRFAIVVNGQIHNFSLLTEFLESPQAKSKSEGLGLKRPCFAHSPFAKFFGLGTGDVVCYIETDLVRQAVGGSGSGSNPGDQKSGGSSGSGSSSSGRKKKSGKKE